MLRSRIDLNYFFYLSCRDCARQCDADEWNYVKSHDVCEAAFNVPTYALVDDENKSITMPQWSYGPVVSNETIVLDFQNGLEGELGMLRRRRSTQSSL